MDNMQISVLLTGSNFRGKMMSSGMNSEFALFIIYSQEHFDRWLSSSLLIPEKRSGLEIFILKSRA